MMLPPRSFAEFPRSPRVRSVWRAVCGVAAVLSALSAACPAEAYLWQRPGLRDAVLLSGYGEWRVSYLTVTGDSAGFAAAVPGGQDGVSGTYRASMLANGPLARGLTVNGAAIVDSRFDDGFQHLDPSVFRLRLGLDSSEPVWGPWRLTANALYDPRRLWDFENLDRRLLLTPQQDARLEALVRLATTDDAIAAGSQNASFAGSDLTLVGRSVFGGTATVREGVFAADGVAARLQGGHFRENGALGLRADGTSGPFDLTNAPVVRGSDEVRLEVRDRFDSTRVIRSETLRRDVDYTLDPVRGRVLLHRPVESETIEGDPQYVVITYDFDRDPHNDVYGGRAAYDAHGVRLGGTWLGQHVDRTIDGALDEPQRLIGGEFALPQGALGHAKVEWARSRPVDGSAADDADAIRGDLEFRFGEHTALRTRYSRLDDGFQSFANAGLLANLNQERLAGDFRVGYRPDEEVWVDYDLARSLQSGARHNAYPQRPQEALFGGGWRYGARGRLQATLQYHERLRRDRDGGAREANQRHQLEGELRAPLGTWGPLGRVRIENSTQLIDFDNDLTTGEHSTRTTQQALRLVVAPQGETEISVAQRLVVLNDRVLQHLTDRQDATFLDARSRLTRDLSVRGTYEFKRVSDLRNDVLHFTNATALQREASVSASAEWIPLARWKALGRYERHASEDLRLATASSRVRDAWYGQGVFTLSQQWSVEYELERQNRATRLGPADDQRTVEQRARLLYHRDERLSAYVAALRRDVRDDIDPLPLFASTSYLWLAGGQWQMSPRVDLRLAMRELRPEDTATRDLRRNLLGECGVLVTRDLRLGLGYQHIHGTDAGDGYTAHGPYLTLRGKI